MKRIYMAPQAKPGSSDARPESLLDRLRTGRGVKAITGAVILSATLLLAGCGDKQGENPSNPDANNSSEGRIAQGQDQEEQVGNELKVDPDNLEVAALNTAYTALNESLEKIAEEDSENITFVYGDESTPNSGILTNHENSFNMDSFNPMEAKGKTVVGVKGLVDATMVSVITDEDYLNVIFESNPNFNLPKSQEEAADLSNSIMRGELPDLTIREMSYTDTDTTGAQTFEDLEGVIYFPLDERSSEARAADLNEMRAEISNIFGGEILEVADESDVQSFDSGLEEGTNQHQSGKSTLEEASPEQSPAQVLALQYEHINSGDYQAAYELFAEESQEVVSLDQYRAFFEDVGYYQLADYSFPSVDVQGDSAVVKVNLISDTPTGEAQYQRVQQMVLEDGEWRVVMRDEQIEIFTETG